MFVNDNGYNCRLTLVIRSINHNKYDIKCLNNLIRLSIFKEEVDNLDMKYIVDNFIIPCIIPCTPSIFTHSEY